MDTINANTKISTIIRQHPGGLEAIISLSPKFSKLRNPLLRKMMASRTSIGMASRIGGCTVDDFFQKLQTLGFVVDKNVTENMENIKKEKPGFMINMNQANVIELDVREVLASGKDPLNLILGKTKEMRQGQILKLINTFEPVPLLKLLGKQGFEHYVEALSNDLVHTWFHKTTETKAQDPAAVVSNDDWNMVLKRFEGQLTSIDVRELEMPQPMISILSALDQLEDGKALFVYHKRIPVFLLPELAERKFEFRIKEIGDAEVHLLIYRD